MNIQMQLAKFLALVSAGWFLSFVACGDTLTFVAQPGAGGIDHDWFNSLNWFTTDNTGTLVPAGRVPLVDEAAIITGTVDLGAGGIRVQTLVVTNNATITNGTVAAENVQLLTSSSIYDATVNVLQALTVAGTNCVLNATTSNILPFAVATLQAGIAGTESWLVLTQGSILQVAGVLSLTDRSKIMGGGLPQSTLVIRSNAFLISTNSAEVRGAASGHLIIDNSGMVRADSGTLSFNDGIDWQSVAGVEEFRAAGPSSSILFSSPFHADSSVISLFTGDGTNRWLSGGTIDGVAQISTVDPGSQLAGPGHLEFLDSVTGAGLVHILGTANQGGVGSWLNGTLALPGVSVDPGATLLIGGTSGTSRQLTGCVITNLGLCTFRGGSLDFGQSAVFNNQAGATFVVQSDGTFSSSAGGGTFNNDGTFQKISTGVTQFGTTNSTPGPGFNNSGLLDLRTGQLNLLDGTSSGEFRLAQGSVLWFWGGIHTLNTGASFTGNGTSRLLQGASAAEWLVNDSITVPQLELGANGTLDASGTPATTPIQLGTLISHDDAVITNGSFQVQTFQMRDQTLVARSAINVPGTLTVIGTNCTLSGTTLTLPPGASGILQPSSAGLGSTLNLTQGAVVQDGGQLSLTGGSIITGATSPQSKLVIQAGAILSSTNSNFVQGSTNAPLIIDNNGTLRVDGGILTLTADFNNSGQLEVLNGALAFQGAWTQAQGTTIIDSGATLIGPNLNVLGGTVSGSGTLNANVVNTGGTISPGDGVGSFVMGQGQNYQQGASASLSVELGGTNSGVNYDQFAVGGSASLDGELLVSLVNGFVPSPGQTFQVLRSSSLSGKFANITTPSVAGTAWVPRYSATGVTLVFAGNVNLAQPVVSNGTLSLSIQTTTGLVYVVQATDELNPPSWQTASTIVGDGTVKTFSEAATHADRFYRVLLE